MKLLLLAAAIVFTNIAYSQTAIKDSTDSKKLDEVVVSGSVLKAAIISKNGLKEMDLPQAISILDNKILARQQIANFTDILKNVNGIYISGTAGGYQEEIASRGSNISSTNTFKNGIRFFSGMKMELSGVEKVEILKGNTAIEYGNVAPGGVLNLVTKKPKFNFGGSLNFTLASFEKYKPQFDIYGALNKKKTIAARLNGSYEKANSFRNNVQSNSVYFNPSILFKLSKKSIILVEGDYNKSNTTPDFGAGIVNYTIADIPRERFVGVSWGNYKAKQTFVSTKYTRKINENTSVNILTAYRNYNTDLFANARPNSSGSVVLASGLWKRNIQKTTIAENYFIQQIDFNTYKKTGSLSHQILIGLDAEQFKTNTTVFNAKLGYDQINIFNDYKNVTESTIPLLTENTLTKNPVNRFGAYIQDLISFPKFVKILVGARYNIIKSNSDVFTYANNTTVNTETKTNPFSPKIGIVLQPSKKITLFTSYSNSFALNTGIDIAGNALNPSIINQVEIGIKNKLYNGKLQLNATVYEITNSNLAQVSLVNNNTNSNVKELAGKTKSKGLEIDAIYKPKQYLAILLGYSFNETKFKESNIFIIGSELKYNPKNTANLSANYNFEKGKLKNLNIGFISQYFGTRYAGRSTRLTVNNDAYRLIKLDDYVLLDFTLSYKYENWSINGKYANILNELNYNIHDDNSLNPIAPSNFSVQVGINF